MGVYLVEKEFRDKVFKVLLIHMLGRGCLVGTQGCCVMGGKPISHA